MQVDDRFIRETIHMHHLFQMGSFVSEIIEMPSVRLVYIDQFKNIWYNSANDIRIEEHEVDDMLHQVETFFKSRDRTPSIYVSPVTNPDLYQQSLPSADVKEKIQSCIKAFKSGPPLIKIQYFVAKYHGEPAGMLTSLRLGDYCGLYSGATIEKFQGKGIMRALMDHATTLAEETGVKCLLFNSVVGTKGVVVYPKLGYIPLFSRDCYVPVDSIDVS